jgi:hypothetical protein
VNFPKYRIATLGTLGVGALFTIAALFHTAGFSGLLNEFAFWALGPYAVFCGACFLARSRGRAIATLVVSAVASAFALLVYGDLIFIDPGSMSGLVFLFVPFYQLPASIILLAVMFFTRRRNG